MMKYKGMDVEILGGPGKYYWQISGTVNDMPYSETAEHTCTDSQTCARECKKAVDVALTPQKADKPKKKKKSGPPVVHGS